MSGAELSPSGGRASLLPVPAPVVEVFDARDAARYVADWEDLADHALEPNPTYEHWVALAALASYPEDVRFVAVRLPDARLGALLPLVEARRYRGLPATVLASWQPRHCLLHTPLVRAGAAAEALQALLEWARANAALLELGYFPAGGPVHCALTEVAARLDMRGALTDVYTRALLRKAASLDNYLSLAMSGDSRRKLARKRRRLAEQGRLEAVHLAPGDDARPWIDAFLELEASGWKGERRSALACSEAGRAFAHAMLGEAHRRGRLMLSGLDLDGRAIARCCTILAGEGAIAFRTAYDERYAQYSPGVLAELDRMGAFHAAPGAAWLDSYTGRVNPRLDALWKDRVALQVLTYGLRPSGELALAALGFARWAKHRFRGKA